MPVASRAVAGYRDGGATWAPSQRLGDEVSILGFGRPAGDGTWDQCTRGIVLGEYAGLTATTDEQTGDAVFHAVWVDLRGCTYGWRGETDPEENIHGRMGDIFTDKVAISDPSYGTGDYDRDYDVDMDDFAFFSTCGVTPVPVECE